MELQPYRGVAIAFTFDRFNIDHWWIRTPTSENLKKVADRIAYHLQYLPRRESEVEGQRSIFMLPSLIPYHVELLPLILEKLPGLESHAKQKLADAGWYIEEE